MKSYRIFLLLFVCNLVFFTSKSDNLASDSLYNIAVELFQQEEYDQALHYLVESSEQVKKLYGDTSLLYRDRITECGYLCVNLDRIEDAINFENIAYNITKQMPKEHIKSVKNLIDYNGDFGDFEKVRTYLKELVLLNELVYTTNEEKATGLMEISEYYHALNDFEEEEKAIRSAIDIDVNNDEQNMMRNYSLFKCLESSQKYDEAILVGVSNLKIWMDNLTPTDSTYALCGVISFELGECYYNIGNYIKAVDLYNQAIEILDNTGGKNDILAATTHEALADSYNKLGLFSNAIDNEKATLDILLNVVGNNNPKYAIALSNLAYYYTQMGMKIEAMSAYQEAYDIKKDLAVDADYLLVTSNLADGFANLGNFEKAIELGQQVLDYRALSKEENTFEYAASLNNLATYISHHEDGDIKRAISLQEESIHVLSSLGHEFYQYYINALSNLSVLYHELGDDEKSLSILKDCINSYDNIEVQNDWYKSTLYYNLASSYFDIGEYDEANEFLIDAYEIMVKYGQTNMIQFVQVLIGLYNTNLKKGEIDKAKYWLAEVEKNNHNQVINCFPFLTSHERSQFWHLLSDWYQYYMPKCLPYLKDEESLGEIYNAVLLSKGILLGTDIEVGEVINNNYELSQLRQTQNLLENGKVNLTSFEIDSLLQSVELKEKQLLIDSGLENTLRRYYSITYQDVGNSLENDEIAIEFILAKEDSMDVYYAICHKREYAYPHLIKLTNDSTLAVNDNGNGAGDGFFDNIWQPLKGELSNVRNIYFAPAGIIHIIPIESANFDNTRIGDQYNIYRLSSTRQLVNKKTESQLNSAVLYGGLSYDAKIEDIDIANKSLNNTAISNPYMDRFPIEYSMSVAYLPSTKEEVEDIYYIISKTMSVCKYVESAGTEESFKALSGLSINLLHISTHGFFWSDDNKIKNNSLRLVDNFSPSEDKAMTRSGLYLSGVNNYFQNQDMPNNMEDGVLTAREISKIDLHDLNIVVLSACETGRGELKSDGVFGLQRGFKKAGAKTILMSLWKVNDIATKLLMVEFYKNFFSGFNKLESLRKAQQYVQDYKDENGIKLFDDPHYWAGFILLDALD